MSHGPPRNGGKAFLVVLAAMAAYAFGGHAILLLGWLVTGDSPYIH